MKRFKSEARNYKDIRQTFWGKVGSAPVKTLGAYYRKKIQTAYHHLIPSGSSILEVGCGDGDLLASLNPSRGVGIDFSSEFIHRAIKNVEKKYPVIQFIEMDAHEIDLDEQSFDYIIISDLVGDLWDVQAMLAQLKPYCDTQTRVIFNFYSHLWNIPLRIARTTGLATPNLPQNWLTKHDMTNLLEISDFQVLRQWEEIAMPVYIPLLSNFANRYLTKMFPVRYFAMANFMIARPLNFSPQMNKERPPCPTVSIVVAARNESGHIDELIERIPEMGGGTEIIFVEGNSTDDTYEKIEQSIKAHPHRNCQLFKQPGKGKGDAVRVGFSAASGDILMILDADITVPPEDLPRFYELMDNGSAEFVNGVRLVYPMIDDAMRFANLLGNKFFSWAFSWLLGQPIRDTLCGTKVLWRKDYHRIEDNRAYFGDFDPFGDFDLLFGAARLNLKIMEVPIRYRARRYGDTNISRWRHGVLLLKMVIFAARRIKFV